MWQITYTFAFTILIRIPLLVTSYWSHLMKVTSFRSLLECSLCRGKNSWIFHTLIFNPSTLWDHLLIFLVNSLLYMMLGNLKKVTYWYNETWIAFKTHIEIILRNHLWQFMYIHYYNDNINVGNLIMVTYNEVTSIWSHVVHLVCLGRNSSNFQALILTLSTPLLCQCTLE